MSEDEPVKLTKAQRQAETREARQAPGRRPLG